MTTYHLIEKKEKELEEAESKFNLLHREAKYYKINTLQVMQRELNELIEKWKRELKNK